MNLKTIILSIYGGFISAFCSLSLNAQEKPNIIFIMADDLGYSISTVMVAKFRLQYSIHWRKGLEVFTVL